MGQGTVGRGDDAVTVIDPEYFFGLQLTAHQLKCDSCKKRVVVGRHKDWYVGEEHRIDIYGHGVTMYRHMCPTCYDSKAGVKGVACWTLITT